MSISIFLIEDSPTQAAMSKMDLETLAPDVVVELAMTAARAMSRLQNPNIPLFDLVILDMTLPDGNGLDVCRAIKVNPRTRNVPVVVLA